MTYLVLDIGTSGIRAAVVTPEGRLAGERRREMLPATPAPGLVEIDAAALATTALALAREVLAETGAVQGVGVTNQRGSTVVWDAATGEPVGPALGWQDLRTVGDCLVLRAEGLRLAPNQSATKIRHLLDGADPGRTRDLRAGTIDSWVVWHLTGGAAHVTDPSNAGITGLLTADGAGWDLAAAAQLGIPESALPRIVDSVGAVAEATALPGSPPILALAGDQQASLAGQGCVAPGQAKATFGTGAMLDLVLGPEPPAFTVRGPGGTFPIVAWRREGRLTWGIEAIMLSAGTNVEWLREDLGLLTAVEESHEVAQGCATTDGVVYVPALLGLGTPHWDYGARGTLLGITRGTGRAEVVRAVLEGVAQRGADLLEAAEADGGHRIATLRIDGGMSCNPTFVQALADAVQRPVEVSPVVEATAVGVGLLASLADGTRSSWDDVAATWEPARVVEPGPPTDRARWADALERARAWYPDLTGVDF